MKQSGPGGRVRAPTGGLCRQRRRLRLPTLVIDTEAERAFAGQARTLYDALTCQKTFLLFTAEEGAEDHCQVGSPLLSAQRTFDWLQETLSRAPAPSTA